MIQCRSLLGLFGCACRRTDLGITRELDPTKKGATKNFRFVISGSLLLVIDLVFIGFCCYRKPGSLDQEI